MTKKNTDYRTKGKAVFLAALMVISMLAVPMAFAGSAAAANESVDVDDLNGEIFFQGQEVTITGFDGEDDGTTVQLRSGTPGDSSFVTNVEIENEEIELDTSDFDGEHFLRGSAVPDSASPDDDGDSGVFEVAVQNVDFEFEEDSVAADGALNLTWVSDNRGGSQNITVAEENGEFDADELEAIFADNDASQVDDEDEVLIEDVSRNSDILADFDDVDAGNYSFVVSVEDTTAEDTAEIEVLDEIDGDAELVDVTVTQEQGGLAKISIDLEGTDEAFVGIGNLDDIGYEANFTVTDEDDSGTVEVYFNSYTAGISGADVVTPVDDEETSVSDFEQTGSTSSILDQGDYEVGVSIQGIDEAYDDPDAVGTLVISDRTTDAWNLWTASESAVDDVEDADDVAEALDEGLITQASDFAEGDIMIHQLEASGLDGLIENTGADNSTAAFEELLTNDDGIGEDDSSLDLRIRQTSDTTPPNTDRKRVDLVQTVDNDGITVIADGDNDQYFIVMNPENVVMQDGADGFEDGEEYNIRFRVQDDRLLDVDEDEVSSPTDEYQTLENSFSVSERDASFDQEEYEVENDGEQEFTGTTNIAPGTELNVRLRSTSASTPFIETRSGVEVQEDGTFSASFDFSDTSDGDEFRLTLRDTGLDDDPTATGVVVEAEEEETETETEETEETETPTETEEPETEEPETEEPETEAPADDDGDDETGDDTPGFGALVALVALIGAAMLAVRRQN